MSKGELSKNLLSMKFMQRRQQAAQLQKQRDEDEQKLKEAHWVLNEDVASGVNVRKDERTYLEIPCGRRSFGNFNPAVERLGKKEEAPKIVADNDDQSWSATFRHHEFLKTKEGQEQLAQKKSVYGRDRKRRTSDPKPEQTAKGKQERDVKRRRSDAPMNH